MRRRKVVYPPPANRGKGVPARPTGPPTNAVSINTDAMTRRPDIIQGARVRIVGGTYEGELGVVESVVGGVIPAAVVRTGSGPARRVRTVDLRPDDGG